MNSSLSTTEIYPQLTAALEALGLVAMGWRDAKTLPQRCWLNRTPPESGSLLVLGNGGGALWPHFSRDRSASSAQPLDDYSLNTTDAMLAEFLACDRQALFPVPDCPLDLVALLDALAWQRPSPLGLGINRTYGLWSAVRAVWWLDATAPAPVNESVAPDLCARCESQACVSACPAGAVTLGALPDLGDCATYRFAPASRCEQTCVAREACPVAPEHRYGGEQMAFHYRLEGSLMAQFRRESDACPPDA